MAASLSVIRLRTISRKLTGVLYMSSTSSGNQNSPAAKKLSEEAKKPTPSARKEDGTKYECNVYYQHHPLTYNDYEGEMRQYRLQQPSALK